MARSRNRLGVDERRKQLLELGMRLFTQRSYDEISIDDIAEAAGISKGLLYHYFPSKREFYVGTIRAAAARLEEVTEGRPDDPPAEQLRQGLLRYFEFVEEHGPAYAALLRSGIGEDPEVGKIVDASRATFVERTLRQTPLGTSDALRLMVRAWLGLVEGASLAWLEHPEVSKEPLVAELAEILIGILGRERDGSA